jgi:hypothetical protein
MCNVKIAMNNNHPYRKFEGTPLWDTVEKAVSALIANGDITEKTAHEHIVGYFCNAITQSLDVAGTSDTEPITVYVQLLNEGTFVSRETKALSMGDGLYKILPVADCDPEDEEWEFKPGEIVKIKKHRTSDGFYLLAIAP